MSTPDDRPRQFGPRNRRLVSVDKIDEHVAKWAELLTPEELNDLRRIHHSLDGREGQIRRWTSEIVERPGE